MDELERIGILEGKLNEMDKLVSVSSVLVEKFSETQEKLVDAIQNLNLGLNEIRTTMALMQQEITTNSRELADVKARITKQDDNNNINLIGLVKANILPLIMFAYIVIEHVTGVVK